MGRLWLLGGVAMVALWISLFSFPETADWWTARDTSILEWFVGMRTSSLTSLADALTVFGSSWFLRVLRIGTVIEGVVPDVSYRGNWYFTFEGGCITYEFDASGDLAETVAEEATESLGFYPALELRTLAEEQGLDIG